MDGRQGEFGRIEARLEAEWLVSWLLLLIISCVILSLTCGCVGMLDAGCWQSRFPSRESGVGLGSRVPG